MTSHLPDRLEYLAKLIFQNSTGSPTQLRRKLNISERRLYDQIHLLKEHGAPVSPDRKRNSIEDIEYFLENNSLPGNHSAELCRAAGGRPTVTIVVGVKRARIIMAKMFV